VTPSTLRLHFIFLLAAGIAAGCANPSQPQGGEKDKSGPVLREKNPTNFPDRSVNIRPKEITFSFDEYLKPGNYSQDIFVSPIPVLPPEILVSGKDLKIRFREDLYDSTTYVIVFGTGISDFTEGNKMEKPLVFAFSTGPFLDSMMLRGSVRDPVTGKGLEGYTAMLFDADSVPDNDFFGKTPTYLANSEKFGAFKFYYLKKGNYKIYAVKDEDHSHSYSQKKEFIALKSEPEAVFADSGFGKAMVLQAFLPDMEAPVPKSAKWINERTMLIDFKEKLSLTLGNDSLLVHVSDTAGESAKPVMFIQEMFQAGGRESSDGQYLFYCPEARKDPVKIQFQNLMDTLGNSSDTSIIVLPGAFEKKFQGKAFLPPQFIQERAVIRLNTTLPLQHSQHDSLLTDVLVDSAGKPIEASAYIIDFGLEIRLKTPPTRNIGSRIVIRRDFKWWDGSYLDSSYTFPLTIPGFEATGSISGFVRDSANPGNWITGLYDQGGNLVRSINSKQFDFQHVPEGIYKIRLVDDADGNGTWSPGSSNPYHMPESVYLHGQEISIKAKWAIEEFEIVLKKEPEYPETDDEDADETGKKERTNIQKR